MGIGCITDIGRFGGVQGMGIGLFVIRRVLNVRAVFSIFLLQFGDISLAEGDEYRVKGKK